MKTNLIRLLLPAIAQTRRVLTCLGLGLAIALVTGCGQRETDDPETTADTFRQEAAEAVDAAGEHATTMAADLRARLVDQAQKLNARLETLKEDTQEGSTALAERTQKQLDRVNDALARLDSATADQRERVQDEVSDLLDDIQAWWDSRE